MNLNRLAPSASLEILGQISELKSRGRQIFSLAVGDTHFTPPKQLVENFRSLPKPYSHYSISSGIVELREEISSYHNGFFSPKDILVTPGLKQGLLYALAALEHKKVCVLEPAWLGYKALLDITDKSYVRINRYQENWIETLAQTDFDVLILCSPNNPDGYIFDVATVEAIRTILQEKRAWVITDEIYEQYDYTNANPAIHRLYDYERVIVGNGLSKSHAMTGFRIGYVMTTDKMVMNRISAIHQNMATCAATISQYFSLGFSRLSNEIKEYKEYYRSNRELVRTMLSASVAFVPSGGFYYFIDLSRYGIHNATHFCQELLEQKSVACIPGGAYGTGFDSYIRLSFSIDRNELLQALPLIDLFINEYRETSAI
jgi:aspartate/methionine/tyrosine aminotransferase